MKTSERLKSLKQAEPFVLRLADGRRIPEITAKHHEDHARRRHSCPVRRASRTCAGSSTPHAQRLLEAETFQHVLPRSACRIIPTLNRHAIVPGSGMRSG